MNELAEIQGILSRAVVAVAHREDEEQRRLDERRGIFHMPELAFVYEVEKEIHRLRPDFKTLREKDRYDLVIWREDEKAPARVEFKIASGKYQQDLEKLGQPPNGTGFFCALVDAEDGDLARDGRISTDNVNVLDCFATSDTYCVIVLKRV